MGKTGGGMDPGDRGRIPEPRKERGKDAKFAWVEDLGNFGQREDVKGDRDGAFMA